MPDFRITAGDTSKTIYFKLRDSTTGLAKTGLVFNSPGASASYTLPGAAAVPITMASLASASATWTSGGFILISDTIAEGLYRLDLPDAAIASGDFVIITVSFDGTISESTHIPLDAAYGSVLEARTLPAASYATAAGLALLAPAGSCTTTIGEECSTESDPCNYRYGNGTDCYEVNRLWTQCLYIPANTSLPIDLSDLDSDGCTTEIGTLKDLTVCNRTDTSRTGVIINVDLPIDVDIPPGRHFSFADPCLGFDGITTITLTNPDPDYQAEVCLMLAGVSV